MERYENEDSIKRHNREPISYKVKKEHVKFALDEIKKNKTITIEVLLSKLKDKFKDLELTRRHLSDIIKDNKKKLSSYLAILLLYKRFDLIKKVFKFLPQNQMNYFKMFENKIKKLESLQYKLRKTSLFVNKIYGIFDKDLRNHLLY